MIPKHQTWRFISSHCRSIRFKRHIEALNENSMEQHFKNFVLLCTPKNCIHRHMSLCCSLSGKPRLGNPRSWRVSLWNKTSPLCFACSSFLRVLNTTKHSTNAACFRLRKKQSETSSWGDHNLCPELAWLLCFFPSSIERRCIKVLDRYMVCFAGVKQDSAPYYGERKKTSLECAVCKPGLEPSEHKTPS
jgi:hypothetical protein